MKTSPLANLIGGLSALYTASSSNPGPFLFFSPTAACIQLLGLHFLLSAPVSDQGSDTFQVSNSSGDFKQPENCPSTQWENKVIFY